MDWVQNSRPRSTVAPYSLRAGPWPLVSTPVTWEELATGAPLAFGPDEVLERLERLGDPFAAVLELDQDLPR